MTEKTKRQPPIVAEFKGQGDDCLWSILPMYIEYQSLPVLTDDLVKKLFMQGWPLADLRWAQGQGARYSKERNSLVFPPKECE